MQAVLTRPGLLTDKLGEPFLVRPYRPDDRAALEEMYRDFEPSGEHLLVEVEGRLSGHLMLVPIGGETVELANFLHQSIRNRGIGTAINRLGVERAREAGYRRVWLSVEPSNRPALRSYEKAGFRRLPGSLWAPEIEMAVQLAPA
jgi:RimJ/RimL family protein N-acetyltransferase